MNWQNQYCENQEQLPKVIYMFNAVLIKTLMTFTTDLKNHLEAQKTANSQGNIEQKEQC
jgi:hypothetical protein